MKKIKKVLFSLLIGIFTAGMLGTLNTVRAESAGPMYLGIVALRKSGYGYEQSEKKVWKIAKYDSQTGTTADLSNLIYCIKAGAGFGSENYTTTIKNYNQRFNLKDRSSIPSPYNGVLPTGENYNKLLWVIDHMYTEIGSDNATARVAFLDNAIPSCDSPELLTDDDIDVVQQLAIWYFTNPDGMYHYNDIGLYINATKNVDADYKTFEDLDSTNGWDRQSAAKALYSYYINSASGTYTSNASTSSPVTLVKNNAKMNVVGDEYVAGPYKITDNNLGLDYTVSASYRNHGTSTAINPKIKTKDNNGNLVTTTKILKEIVGSEFYLTMPKSSNISGIDMTVNSGYSTRTAEYWSVENSPATEQPVVLVKYKPFTFTDSASLVVNEDNPFDLSLRKFITEINGQAVSESREPQVNVSALAAGTSTTATYNHTKTPLKVAIGDTVTYKIRVYNEGKVDGYVQEITDHLPDQLEFIADDPTNTQYEWELSSDLKTVKTAYLSKENETSSRQNKLALFNGTSLAYKDVLIKCKVKSTTPMPNKITNIAEITGHKAVDNNGNEIENKADRDSQPSNVTLPSKENLPNYKDQEIARGEEYIPGQQDDDDFEKVMIKEFDLSLRKFITGVNATQVNDREPQVNVAALKAGTSTTATYNHKKTPITVNIGDTVIYTIRVYNEGEVDGYANEVTDHLPAQLEYLPDNEINKQYEWTVDTTNKQNVKTAYLSKANETSSRVNKINAFNGTTLNYKDIKIACKVVETNPMVKKITNIADITAFVDGNGNTVKDRDSQENNVNIPSDLPGYKDDEMNKQYIPGQQDDDDFEKVMIKEFDLALRKFITGVNDTEVKDRIPQPDVTALAAGTATTATYNHKKTPLSVNIGDTVIYTIRVYNEGGVDGYANEVTDHLPAQLEYLPDNEINKQYEWTVDTTNKQNAKTAYLSKAKETSSRVNKINAFNGTTLEYKDVKIACKVVETNPMVKKITNIADITAFVNGNGNTVTDRDSQEKNVNIPSDLPGYKDNEINKPYVPGQQDDDDFEKVQIGQFDLALRKFITGVNNTEIKDRIPQVDVSALASGKSTTATYNHTKEPVLLSNGCVVTYTIRIFNEGEVNGYAKQVKDDIPEGLEYLPDHETNKSYRWVMLDKDDKETTNKSEAVSIATDYLSKEQGEARMQKDSTLKTNPALLKAFDGKTLDYKDVKIAFKVTEPNTSDRIIINKAQIAKHTNENGGETHDRDSTPNKWNEGEDDQDIEKVKVQYFDLALRKWVTQAIVIDDGKTNVTETGHKAEDDPEAIVKVDLKSKKLNKVTVKFRYKIRVTNEGQIAGYAKEIKDYIPDGLKFDKNDNQNWTALDDKTIVTDQAKDTLLQPGESTEVEVLLTWINGNDNLGLKDNWAEISKDYNEFNSPDIDSTPNNQKKGEDDIDDAPVMLSVQTGQIRAYVLITGAVLVILGSGIALIKKYVK